MPPKKIDKDAAKKKAKVIEDKTFGLKNKKGKSQQKFIETVHRGAGVNAGPSPAELRKAAEAKKQEEAMMMGQLFKPVEQKAKPGEDPASLVCAFFKKGLCTKGDKCKFSHNLAMERKGPKRDMFSDVRELSAGAASDDNMTDWDQAKLESVVKQKSEKQTMTNPTSIICKHFLEALEKQLYGWFWVCPNGGDTCKYRHALPPGYVLKREKKALEAAEAEISIEELVERERAALGTNLTPVNLQTFMTWKKKKLAEKRATIKEETAQKKKTLKAGHTSGVSGRDLFTLNPEMAGEDDAEAGDAGDYARQEVVIDTTPLEGEDEEATAERIARLKSVHQAKVIDVSLFSMMNDADFDDDDDVGGAGPVPAAAAAAAAAAPTSVFEDADLANLQIDDDDDHEEEEEDDNDDENDDDNDDE